MTPPCGTPFLPEAFSITFRRCMTSASSIVVGVAVYSTLFCSVRMSRLARDLPVVLVSRPGRHFSLGQFGKLTLPVRERRSTGRWLRQLPICRIGSLSRSTLRVKQRQQRSVGETEQHAAGRADYQRR